MIARILAAIAVAATLAAGVGFYMWDDARADLATARASLKMATDANDALVKDRNRHKAEIARVQAQAIRLTETTRALQAAAATFSENLSDAAKACPVLDADRAALHCMLNPGTDGCGADGKVIAR